MIRLLTLLLLPFFFVACSDIGPQDDVADVRACFDNYFAALKTGDGEKAATLVDNNTMQHFARMLDLARNADSVTVRGLDAMDQMTVLSMRMQIPADELQGMDARAAVARSVSQGMMADGGLDGLGLGDVSVEGDKATAPLKMFGFPTPTKFSFQREDGQWRIDLTSLFDLSKQALGKMAGGDEEGNAMLMTMLEENTGMPVPASVWHPVK